MYSLNPSKSFLKKLRKLIQKDKSIEVKIEKTLDSLAINPESTNLRSHKVITKNGITAFSSRITGDLRVIWDCSNNEIHVLDLLDIGGHSGNNSVY